MLLGAHSGNILDNRGSGEASAVSAAICLAVLPCKAVTVEGLHRLDSSSAVLVNLCWKEQHSVMPRWLQVLVRFDVTTTTTPPPVLVAALSTPAYDHVLCHAMKHAPQLLQLHDANGCTALHHMLASVVLRVQSGQAAAFSTLTQRLQALLYAGVPLHLINKQSQTATKTARLAIQRHRADNPDHARSEARYFMRVESLLDALEKLQAAGTSLQFFTREVEGERQAVVSAPALCMQLARIAAQRAVYSSATLCSRRVPCCVPGSPKLCQSRLL